MLEYLPAMPKQKAGTVHPFFKKGNIYYLEADLSEWALIQKDRRARYTPKIKFRRRRLTLRDY